jgi:endonuclease VIII
MAEGDTILRTARRLEVAVGGQELAVRAGNGRGRAAGVARLDGCRLERVEARGKHLLLHFGALVLHSHLGMSGSWQVVKPGDRWRKPASAAWVTLAGETAQVVQFGGPTLRVLSTTQLRRDPVLAQLGPDILAPEFDLAAAIAGLRASPDRELGDALLDQRLIAGIGNIFKSEACFAAKANPWCKTGQLSDAELQEVLVAARRLMRESVEVGRPDPAVYRRAGRPCPACGTPIAARGQGDADRRTYWCPRCQEGENRPK